MNDLQIRLVRLLVALVVVSPVAVSAADITLYEIEPLLDQYIGEQAPHGAVNDDLALSFVATPGEYEPASFVVRANDPLKNLEFRVRPLVNATNDQVLPGATLDIRYVKRWYARNFGGFSPTNARYRRLTSELLVHDDGLVKTEGTDNFVRLDGEYRKTSTSGAERKKLVPTPEQFPVRDAEQLLPLTLAADEERQVWVTLHLPDDAPAGDYVGAIELVLEDDVVASVPVSAEVLPFRLADSVVEYSIFYRGTLDAQRPEGSPSSEVKSREQMLADFRNLRAHGVTNPLMYQRYSEGLIEDVLALRTEAGLDNRRVYYLGVNVVDNDDGEIRKRLGDEVTDVVGKARKFGAREVYFFARDEARGEKITYQFPFWEEVRRNGGKIFAAGWQDTQNEPGNFSITGGAEDLFVSLGTLSREEAARWHSKGKRIASYMNPAGGQELPLSWRRNYGLMLWQYDYDASMPYVWQHGYADAWNDFSHNRHRAQMFTYPTVAGPIDTIAWEGFREGVDDVRYLSTLLQLLDDPQARRMPGYAAASAWVAELKELPLASVDLDQVRARTVGHILALSAYAPDRQQGVVQLSSSAIEPGNVATITVTAPVRQTLDVAVDGGGEPVADAPLLKQHRVRIGGLSAGRRYNVTARAEDTDGRQVTLATTQVDSAPGLGLREADSATVDGAPQLTVNVQSNYRASIAVDVDRSLIGWWRFSGEGDDVRDLSGYGHDGELKGNAERVDGWFGRGVRLPGDGSFISFPDIEIPENGTATIEGWFRFRAFAKEQIRNRGLFSGFYQHGDTNHFYFSRTNESFEVASLLSTGGWHHIALTWSGNTGTAKIYIDGQFVTVNLQREVEDIPEIDGLTIGRSAGYLGGLVGSATNTFDGDVDEIRVWNRVLSPSEVAASFRAGPGPVDIRLDGVTPQSKRTLIGASAADQEVRP